VSRDRVGSRWMVRARQRGERQRKEADITRWADIEWERDSGGAREQGRIWKDREKKQKQIGKQVQSRSKMDGKPKNKKEWKRQRKEAVRKRREDTEWQRSGWEATAQEITQDSERKQKQIGKQVQYRVWA
jgi:hypothetical protein